MQVADGRSCSSSNGHSLEQPAIIVKKKSVARVKFNFILKNVKFRPYTVNL